MFDELTIIASFLPAVDYCAFRSVSRDFMYAAKIGSMYAICDDFVDVLPYRQADIIRTLASADDYLTISRLMRSLRGTGPIDVRSPFLWCLTSLGDVASDERGYVGLLQAAFHACQSNTEAAIVAAALVCARWFEQPVTDEMRDSDIKRLMPYGPEILIYVGGLCHCSDLITAVAAAAEVIDHETLGKYLLTLELNELLCIVNNDTFLFSSVSIAYPELIDRILHRE